MACTDYKRNDVDKLNESSYAFHYRSLDSSMVYAERALRLSAGYPSGKAEALNNLAFVNIAKMNYRLAERQLDSVMKLTDNQIELLIADIQQMRLCQRQARNKEFYDYREHAKKRMSRIRESKETLSAHSKRRLVYAESEYSFVSSTYYYYVGLYQQSRKALAEVDQIDVLQSDTAQYLNWLYLYGSGSMIENGTKDEILQSEYDKLLECYLISKNDGYTYWEANAMQSLSEHLVSKYNQSRIFNGNPISIRYFNLDNMPDSLVAGYLAQKSADMFSGYGDVYQTAGSLRTLALCFWAIGDNRSALACLDNALNISGKIKQAPDLIASIHELLSIVYSSMNDKYNSDINRNLYLDMQERTRQDMELDARAAQLDRTSNEMNTMILIIVVLIIVVVLLFIYVLRNKSKLKTDTSGIVKAFDEWKEKNIQYIRELQEYNEELDEDRQIAILNKSKNKRRNIENCAKIALVDSITPLIDRMINEVDKLTKRDETEETRTFRCCYIAELSKIIDDYNSVLTNWIQLRQGEVGLHIESFPLGELFAMLSRSGKLFAMQGITLHVGQTGLWVKADRILTLFMINTLADNARKFTPKDGAVSIYAAEVDGRVEISVEDTGKGMTKEELDGVFCKKIADGHGFGLLNCRGILNKYRKTSSLFNGCEISAESKVGKGSRFFFQLPKGMSKGAVRAIAMVISVAGWLLPCSHSMAQQQLNKAAHDAMLAKAAAFADSAYNANLTGNYEKTIAFGDSAIQCLNYNYSKSHSKGGRLMQSYSSSSVEPVELVWFRREVDTDYSVILSIRNECAVAALALHQWQLYRYNNDIYTRLFKEVSADKTLGEYCRIMQRTETNKNIAVVFLVILFAAVLIIGYVLYYRRVIKLHSVNEMKKNIIANLGSMDGTSEKLEQITQLSQSKFADSFKSALKDIAAAYDESVKTERELTAANNAIIDETGRLKYENDRLYVSNNILENCLSTIKHETMYYPSRIHQCVANGSVNTDIETVGSLVKYYKQLYEMLSEHVHREVDAVRHNCQPVSLAPYIHENLWTLADEEMVSFLFQILKKQNNGSAPECSAQYTAEGRICIAVCLRRTSISNEERSALFVPADSHVPYLVCRQILRDIGAMSNFCGSGITVINDGKPGLTLKIVLPAYKKK